MDKEDFIDFLFLKLDKLSNKHNGFIPKEEIESTITNVQKQYHLSENSEIIDWDDLRAQIGVRYYVFIEDNDQAIIDHNSFKKWLDEDKIEWVFWKRYQYYLLQNKRWPLSVINTLDERTTKILGFLGNPYIENQWDRRGLVVGYVQSGKTANYMGLISKGLDVGYNFIIIIAGIHNNLRSQTQARIDEEILGYNSAIALDFNDPAKSPTFGVGKIHSINGEKIKRSEILSLTSNKENGDFNRNTASNIFGLVNAPIILVIKKEKTILQNLIGWITNNLTRQNEKHERIVFDRKLLIIDDEADHASINTANTNKKKIIKKIKNEDNASKINKKIRQLLQLFNQSSYVGYTATPYANIFIDPNSNSDSIGNDLFPRDFIISLSPPSNYIGPKVVFGIKNLNDTNLEEYSPLKIVRYIDDDEDFIASKHKANYKISSDIPPSLQKAIKMFILSSIIRKKRAKQSVSNSMLVHISRFNKVQDQIVEYIDDYLEHLRTILTIGKRIEKEKALQSFHELWMDDLEKYRLDINSRFSNNQMSIFIDWEIISSDIISQITQIYTILVNGTAKDSQIYDDDTIDVIVVGGDKLSRGLTIDGLTISYFMRNATTYDTLMQMGRWFGYKEDYIDLCRLYTPKDLYQKYCKITFANEELRGEFERMANEQKTPNDFGLRIRMHPEILVTARNKMRKAKKVLLSLNGLTRETYVFDKNPDTIQSNFEAINNFVQQLGPHNRYRKDNVKFRTPIWENISYNNILELITNYNFHPSATGMNSNILRKYISN